MTQETQRLIELTKVLAMFAELLCDRAWLVQASHWDAHGTMMHGLLVYAPYDALSVPACLTIFSTGKSWIWIAFLVNAVVF
jgi:hypothetical protein